VQPSDAAEARRDLGSMNQKLRAEDVKRLKRTHDGALVVRALAAASTTFSGMTEFARCKYLRRKSEKHAVTVRACRPSPAKIAHSYLMRAPEKTMHLRPDLLGALLTYAGVRAGTISMVFENTNGLVCGAVADRIQGHGVVLNGFSGSSPPGIDCAKMMDLDPMAFASVVHFPLSILDVIHIDEPQVDSMPLRYEQLNPDRESIDQKDQDAEKHTAPSEHQPAPDDNSRLSYLLETRPSRGQFKSWVRKGCDSLIIATRHDVFDVMERLLPHLAPGGSIAVFSSSIQRLAELHHTLCQRGDLVKRVELIELNLTEHQILPGRSHPNMTDYGAGGYILSAMKVS